MKQIKNSFNLLSKLSNNFTLLLSLAIFIPLCFLILLGFWFLYVEGYVFYFLLLLIVLSFFIYVIYALKKHTNSTENKEESDDEINIKKSPQWSKFDESVYEQLEKLIDEKVKNNIEWEELQMHSLDIISKTAQEYYPNNSEKELAFSVSEFLLAVEEVSSRYRGYIKEYIPFEDRIKVSLLKQGYNHKEKVKTVGLLYNLYRAFRMTSPLVAVASEIRGELLNQQFQNVSATLQNKMKKALLKDVASVCVDLYRGYFKVKDSELNQSKIYKEDKNNQADSLEPLRVAVVGQVSVGKSSLINAITDKMLAEVSIVPSTSSTTVHECKVENVDAIKFVDLVGLNGNEEVEKATLEEMTKSDLILWVLKANQSARKLDSQLKMLFDEFYKKDENLKRKKPSILALLNQVDKLDAQKESIVKDALEYNRQILNPDEILALSLKPNEKFYNLEAVKEYLQKAYNEGINTQLNRRRVETGHDGFVKSVKKIFKLFK